MTNFVIDGDNNVTAYTELPSGLTDVQIFNSEKQLIKLSANWPNARLLDIWNSFAGVAPFDDLKPVKKFTDRKSAVARIWRALQRLTPAAAPQAPPVETTAPVTNETATNANRSDGSARKGSKAAHVLELLRRPSGASLADLVSATGWQAHTVRGHISGTIGKKYGLRVETSRGEDKQRIYRLNP